MNKNRIWMIGSVLVMAVLVLAGWFLGVQPQLAAAQLASQDRAGVETINAAHAATLAKLKKDFEDIGTLKNELAPLTASVPNNPEAPAFVKQVDALVGQTGVKLEGITWAEAQLYTPPAPVDPPADAAATDAATATPTPAPAPAAPVAVAPVTNALITASNFASLSMQITVSGGYDNVMNFVSGLQSGERLFMATGLTTTAGAEGSTDVSATISGLVYVLVEPSAAAAPGAAAPATGSTEAAGN